MYATRKNNPVFDVKGSAKFLLSKVLIPEVLQTNLVSKVKFQNGHGVKRSHSNKNDTRVVSVLEPHMSL